MVVAACISKVLNAILSHRLGRKWITSSASDRRPIAAEMAREIALFVGADPEFWRITRIMTGRACQLYGMMMELPEGLGLMFCRDLR